MTGLPRRLAGALLLAPVQGGSIYERDVAFALEELGKRCAPLLASKGIDWREVREQFAREARAVREDGAHLVLLTRLLARLRDGHAEVRPLPKGEGVRWPEEEREGSAGPGLSWCRSGKRILVKNAWSGAGASGVRPGMEVVRVEGVPAAKWLEDRVARMRDTRGFSTDAQAFYAACHWGLGGVEGTTLSLELRSPDGKTKKVTLTRGSASVVPDGTAFAPAGLQSIGRQRYGKSEAGYGYVHLRDTPRDLPAQLDTMLASIGRVPGLILDFRANGGGSFDHEEAFGRFVPAGKTMPRAQAPPIPSAGPHPYGGPIVAIVDAGVRSAGETASGMLREDGRAYLIGESGTAGMSSQKEDLDLPSGLFSLHFSVRSNKGRFNGGKGIEGIGVQPHEIVEYEAKDLASEVDTLIRRAEGLLADFPSGRVPYRPEEYGWK